MIGKMMKCFAATIAMSVACVTVLAQEKVDNPRYLEWSKYKPGTYIKMDISSAMGQQNIKTIMTTTLKELTPEKALLETKMEISMPGVPAQVTPMVEPAKIEKEKIKPATPEQMPGCKVINKGTEDLKVGDKTYKCNWFEIEMETQGMKITGKMWTCDELPDKLVKNETKTPMGNTTMTLLEFKAVK